MTTMDAALIKRVATTATTADAIRTAVRAAAAVGVPGYFHPGLDESGMTTIWVAMVTTIAKREGAELNQATAGKLVTSAVAGVSAYTLGSKILTWAVPLVLPAVAFAAVPAAVALNAALNAVFTYKLGRECERRFADPTFTKADVLSIGRHLGLVPSLFEIADIKRMIVGD
jgi:uncharacterized protein (DUF697 family)